MPHATLTITLPEDVWIGRLSRSHPTGTFRVLSAYTTGEHGIALIEITDREIDTVIAEINSFDSILDLDILQAGPQRVLLQFTTTDPLLLLTMQESGIPVITPFTIQNGEAKLELTAASERLSRLSSQLDNLDIPFTVESIHQQIVPDQTLTRRQLSLVNAAIDRGYYDTPRTCSLTELASELGIAKSTCSETLHRAEGRIIKQFMETQISEPLREPIPSEPGN